MSGVWIIGLDLTKLLGAFPLQFLFNTHLDPLQKRPYFLAHAYAIPL